VCTLSYLLHSTGYELFFNRDEQHSRPLAIPPQFNSVHNAIYPVDPTGNGTWLAVSNKGLSLALLNYYQATTPQDKKRLSRGQLILSLLETDSFETDLLETDSFGTDSLETDLLETDLLETDLFGTSSTKAKSNIIEVLQALPLTVYAPFQLCIFPADLSLKKPKVHCVKWDGNQLFYMDIEQPLTSSSVDFINVSEKRKHKFTELVNPNRPQAEQHKAFHLSNDIIGKYSVNMQRDDAKTVSISHISVAEEITFNYFDNVLQENYQLRHTKIR
jgi:hypothetical protein